MKTAVWKEGRRQSDEKLLKDKNDRKEMESRRGGEKKVAGWLVHRDKALLNTPLAGCLSLQ